MENVNFGQIVSFVFGIANDCLVDVYDVGDYRKIILPMMVIRRFDAVLEPTKQQVLEMKAKLDAAGITEQDEALCAVAGEAFCNSSPYTLSELRSRTNQQQLKQDFILYLNGFSQNVQDIIRKFEFRNQIDKLSEHDILGLLIAKFTDSSINLSSKPILDRNGEVRLPALDNHTMGTVFEEVIRKFNEETNITDAGRHFTPRDIVELMTDLAFVPVKDQIQSTTYRIYDVLLSRLIRENQENTVYNRRFWRFFTAFKGKIGRFSEEHPALDWKIYFYTEVPDNDRKCYRCRVYFNVVEYVQNSGKKKQRTEKYISAPCVCVEA